MIPISIVKYLLIVSKHYGIYDAFKYLINSLDGDSYYLKDVMVNDELIDSYLAEKICDDLEMATTKDIFLWCKEFSEEFENILNKERK